MNTQPNTGPAELRRLAELLRRRGGHGAYAHADILMQDAAAWEVDRDALNSETARADAAELRANVLGLRDETETMNIGAALFAVILRDDTGAGEMPAGPCADVLAEWRQMRAANERLTAAASGRGMVSEMDGLPEIAVLVVGLHERAAAPWPPRCASWPTAWTGLPGSPRWTA